MYEWDDIIKESAKKSLELGDEYVERLKFEIKEINKQGANEYWINLINDNKKFDHNKNGLVLPYLMGITEVDPVKGHKKLFVNGEDIKIKGVELKLENGTIINTSENTLIKTERGYIKAKNLSEEDEIILHDLHLL